MGDVESVFAKSTTALVDIEAEDTAIVTLKFKNGALGIIEATTAVRPKDLEGSISILGETGTVEIGGFAVNEMKHWNFSEVLPGDDDVFEKFSVNPQMFMALAIRHIMSMWLIALMAKSRLWLTGCKGAKALN